MSKGKEIDWIMCHYQYLEVHEVFLICSLFFQQGEQYEGKAPWRAVSLASLLIFTVHFNENLWKSFLSASPAIMAW